MNVDPPSISERTEKVSRSEMKMNDVSSMKDTADVGDEIAELLED